MNDLISRQEAVAHLQRIREASADTPDYNEGFADGLDYCISFISTLPSAEPKKGKWIISKVNGQYQCSNCGMFTGLTAEDLESGFYLMKYCGNCGARMDEDD